MGSRHKEPGQSRTTLNLTAAAPALIGRLASHGAGAEIPAGKASELSGQTDGASGHLEPSSAGDACGGARQANGGALSPAQVAHGKVARGEFADNHGTARSEGNIRSNAFHDLNIPKRKRNLGRSPPPSPVVQLIITLSSELITGGGRSFSKTKVTSSARGRLVGVAASVAGAWLGSLF